MIIKSKVFISLLLGLITLFGGAILSVKTAYAQENSPPVIDRVHADSSLVPAVGKKIKFIAEAKGQDLKYEWHVYKNDKEIYIGSYSSDNYFEYTPLEEGIYRVDVRVKDGFSNTSMKSCENIKVAGETLLKINSLTIDKNGPELVGAAFKFTADAEGRGLNYQWRVYRDSNEIYEKAYSNENYLNYTAKEPGEYKAVVTVKDENGNILDKSSDSVQVFNVAKINSLTVDKTGKQLVNTTLKFTASAEGYNLTYDWSIYRDGNEIYKNPSSKDNNISYVPKQPGVYRALIYVRDEFGVYQYKYSDTITIYSKDSPSGAKASKEEIEEFINGKSFTSKTKNFMWVDTKENVVYVFEGKSKEWSLIRTMPCTDGKASTPTVKGSFTISGRAPWLIAPNPAVRARYKVRFYNSYYFHSILVNSKGQVIDPRLGQSLSHGCIRLSMENAKWIYDNILDGTGVYIS